jgi:hypothetical protein
MKRLEEEGFLYDTVIEKMNIINDPSEMVF